MCRVSAGLQSQRVHLVAAFTLHLVLYRRKVVRGQLDVVGSDVACVHKVGGIPNHGPVYPEPLMVAPSPGTLRLMKAAREPLQPDIARAGHLTALQFALHPG